MRITGGNQFYDKKYYDFFIEDELKCGATYSMGFRINIPFTLEEFIQEIDKIKQNIEVLNEKGLKGYRLAKILEEEEDEI